MSGQRIRVFERGQRARLVQEGPLRARGYQELDPGQRSGYEGVERDDATEAVSEQDDGGLQSGDEVPQPLAHGLTPGEVFEDVARGRMRGVGERATPPHGIAGTEAYERPPRRPEQRASAGAAWVARPAARPGPRRPRP